MSEEPRSAAAQAGQCDEARLVFDVSGAFTKACCAHDLDAAWRTYIDPVEDSISYETMETLSKLYSLRLSTLAWE